MGKKIVAERGGKKKKNSLCTSQPWGLFPSELVWLCWDCWEGRDEEEEEALGQVKVSAVVSALLGCISHTNNPSEVTFLGLFRRFWVAGAGFFSLTHVLMPPKKGYCSSLGSPQRNWERFLSSVTDWFVPSSPNSKTCPCCLMLLWMVLHPSPWQGVSSRSLEHFKSFQLKVPP